MGLMLSTDDGAVGQSPTVTIVFLVYNRREELRESLRHTLVESDYEPGRVDVIVVDNASTDGSAAMVRAEFPQVRVMVRSENIGVSGWNEGFAAARGDYVLALDDDCYLPSDGLKRAVAAAHEHEADLVSFRVASTHDHEYVFTDKYRTGLFTFWGCAVLMRREVVAALGGYDPEIFVWANELEFMLRFFDRGFCHLHLPEVTAQHMKAPPIEDEDPSGWRGHRINARHFAYIAGKLLWPRDATEACIALLTRNIRDALREDPGAIRAVPSTVRGFVHGLRYRDPVSNAELSRFYRRNFETFASPWWVSRTAGQLVRALPRDIARAVFTDRPRPKDVGRRGQYFDERPDLYPERATVLRFDRADHGERRTSHR